MPQSPLTDFPRTPENDSTRVAPKYRNWAPRISLLVLVFLWSFLRFWSHPEAIMDSRFFAHDLANQLHLNDELLPGKRLYSEVFSQYGPATAYLNALVARVFGNTARALMLFQTSLAIVVLLQVYVLVRRRLSPWRAVLFTTIAVLPWIPSAAGGPGAYIQPYGGFERIILLAAALSWRPLLERTRWRNIILGLLLASLQWFKFGSAFIAGAGLFATDLIILAHLKQVHRRSWKTLVAANALILAGFLAGECALWIYLASTQPWPIARDVLWPVYMVSNYAGYVTWNTRFIDWENLGYFIGAQLPLVAAIVSFAFLLGRLLGRRATARRETRDAENFASSGPFVFLILFWVLGLSGYLAHVWLAMGYAWLLMVGAAAGIARFRPVTGLIVLAAWAPCFFSTARGIWPSHTPTDLKPVTFRNGETLWLDATWQARIEILSQRLAEECGAPEHPSKAVMAFVSGGGIAHYLGYPVLMRHSWFMPGFVRPYDEDAVRASLPHTGALVLFLNKPPMEQLPLNVNRWGMGTIFSDALAAEIPRHFQKPIQVDSTCWFLSASDLSSER
jgi:hypothetical protein